MPDAPDEETFLLAALRLALPDLKIELEHEQFVDALFGDAGLGGTDVVDPSVVS